MKLAQEVKLIEQEAINTYKKIKDKIVNQVKFNAKI